MTKLKVPKMKSGKLKKSMACQAAGSVRVAGELRSGEGERGGESATRTNGAGRANGVRMRRQESKESESQLGERAGGGVMDSKAVF